MKLLSTAVFLALFAFAAGGTHAAETKTPAKAPAVKAAQAADSAASAASAPAKKKKAKKGGC